MPELDKIEKTHCRGHECMQLLFQLYISLTQYKNTLQGTGKYATSISIIYDLDAIEKLTSGDGKVCNFFSHCFHCILAWCNRKTHFVGPESKQFISTLYMSLKQ